MASFFIRNANTFRVAPEESLDLHKVLPTGNYAIRNSIMGFYLEQIDGFAIPSKIYGDTSKHADRILKTFFSRPASTGVMLTGEKGSGKTLLAKMLTHRAAGSFNIPTLLVNEPFHGDAFNTFIQSIEQPCVVLFDEFEKVYDNDEQEAALTLLDGVFPSKKLFVITCNDKWRVNQHMRNRPGRIFYMIEYTGLPLSFIREYCQDNLVQKEYIDKVCEITSLFSEFNFDMLSALVEEMNRYSETPQDALRWLNAKPEYMGNSTFDITLYIEDKKIEDDKLHSKEWSGNPLNGEIAISWVRVITKTGDEEDDYERLIDSIFTCAHIKKVDAGKGVFTFVNTEGQKAVLTRKVYTKFDYLDSF